MQEPVPHYEDEIDLIELIQTLWEGKWQIIAIVLICLAGAGGYLYIQPNRFVATTEIKPISSLEEEQYSNFNALGFPDIDRDVLMDLFVEQLEDKTLFQQALMEQKLISRENFATEQTYQEAATAMASSISVSPPKNVDGTDKGEIKRYWTVSFEILDPLKWKEVLKSALGMATQQVKVTLTTRFEIDISIERQERQFSLEDIALRIKNVHEDYETATQNRLALLREQTAIAHKLGIPKSTLETQTFGSQTNFLPNLAAADLPEYLRGYEALDKEIELIEGRTEVGKRAFIKGLAELEGEKRKLEQDKTLERAETLFALTPVKDPSKKFRAVAMSVDATSFISKSKRLMTLALAGVLGGMIGMVYVLIASAIKKRKIG